MQMTKSRKNHEIMTFGEGGTEWQAGWGGGANLGFMLAEPQLHDVAGAWHTHRHNATINNMSQPSRAAVLGLYKGLRRQGALLMVSQHRILRESAL